MPMLTAWRLRIWFSILFVAFSAASGGYSTERSAEANSKPSDTWALENVELTSSPQVKIAQLENGVHYAVLRHPAPSGGVSVRLLVAAGSANETERERGFAHFVEHLAFRGTRHYPDGELVKTLQRLGVEYGPHINANTSLVHTIYNFDLPQASPEALQAALSISRDICDGIVFDPAALRQEKGVIESEERTRHTFEAERAWKLKAFAYRGTLIPERNPIGDMPTIEGVDAPTLRAFYDAWYRPEYIYLVVVGAVEADSAERLVRENFASLAARGAARALPVLGTPAARSDVEVASIAREQNGFHTSLIQVMPRPPHRLTWGLQLEGIRLVSALSILGRRLEQQTQIPQRVISGSDASAQVDDQRFRRLTVTVASSIDDWEKALGVAEQEVRRALQIGFTADEIAYQQQALRSQIRGMSENLAALPSPMLADALADSLEDPAPFTLLGENLERDLSLVDRVTPEACRAALRKYWGEQPPLIFIEAPARYIPSAEKVRVVYKASESVQVAAVSTETKGGFAYNDFGPPGTVVEKTHWDDLDVWLVRFSNGVRLNLKRTSFEKGRARLHLRVGSGALSEPADQPGLHLWAGYWWTGGVGRHTAAELNRLLDGFEDLNVSSGDDAVTATAMARAEALPFALRELTALIADPAFRVDGYRDTAATLHSQLDPLWNQPEGPIQRFVYPALASNNPHVGLPDPNRLFAYTPDQVRAWLAPQLATGPIELSIVGDFDIDTVLAEAAKTVGALPARKLKPDYTRERTLPPAGKPVSNIMYYGGNGDQPSTLEFFWPMRDPLEARQRRQLTLLASIVKDRLIDDLRRARGATYSPETWFQYNDVFAHLAFIRCRVETKPQEAVAYGNRVRDLIEQLALHGVTSDEMNRAKAQEAARQSAYLSDNAYWLMAVLADAQEHPSRLADARNAVNDVAETTPADINALARKYLRGDHVFRYLIEPSARMPAAKHG